MYCCVLTTGRCKLKEIIVLRPIFPDYVISCDYGLIDANDDVLF